MTKFVLSDELGVDAGDGRDSGGLLLLVRERASNWARAADA